MGSWIFVSTDSAVTWKSAVTVKSRDEYLGDFFPSTCNTNRNENPIKFNCFVQFHAYIYSSIVEYFSDC